LPEAAINLAHGTAYLANAQKDRSAYDAYNEAVADVRAHGNLPIPLNIRNAPTKLMKDEGYSKKYEKYTKEDLLPEKLKGRRYLRE
jgi:putative ATPase